MRMIQSCSKTKTENQISWNTIYKAEVSRREGFCFKPCSVSTAPCRHVLPMPPSRIHWANGCRHPVDLQCRWSMLECEAMTFTFSHAVSIIPALSGSPGVFLVFKSPSTSLQNTRSQGCKPMLRCRWQRGTVHQHHWLICHHLTPQYKASKKTVSALKKIEKGLPEIPDKVSTIHGTSPHYSHRVRGYCLLLHMMCRQLACNGTIGEFG